MEIKLSHLITLLRDIHTTPQASYLRRSQTTHISRVWTEQIIRNAITHKLVTRPRWKQQSTSPPLTLTRKGMYVLQQGSYLLKYLQGELF